MPAAPLGEIFVHKFTVFAQKRIGKDRECHHILLTHLADNIHESFLIFQDIIDIIDDKGAIRVFFAAEKRFKIVSIEYREICESGLIDAEVRLVQLIDDALEFLVSIILRAMNKIVAFAILFPKIKGIDKEAGEATRRGRLCVSTKPDYILLLPLQQCSSFHLRVNSRCTPLRGDSRYRVVKIFS